MSNIPTIEMKDFNETMITLEEAEKISGQTRLTIQKKFKENKIEAVAMLKSGKPGRPSRVFNRGDFNAIYGIVASLRTRHRRMYLPLNRTIKTVVWHRRTFHLHLDSLILSGLINN